MKQIRVQDLYPGAAFSEDVFLDEENSLFVVKGSELRKRDIDRLELMGIDTVFTDGEMTEYTGPQKHEFINNLEVDTEVSSKYTEIVTSFEAVCNKIKNRTDIEKYEIDVIVDELLAFYEKHTDKTVKLILTNPQEGESFAVNSINVTLIAINVGTYMQISEERRYQLITGALLHDIGMLRIKKAILAKKGKLKTDEKQQMQTHPIHSYSIIVKELSYSEEVGFIALQHHERWDGKGYPKKLVGRNILLAARIVNVSDAFIAMVSERPYRDPLIGYAAMKNLLADNARKFDPDILKIFIKSIGIYPIGSLVLLSDSSIGRVTAIHHEAPLRPNIRIIIDSQHNHHPDKTGPEISLKGKDGFYIVRAVNLRELQDAESTTQG